MLQYVIIGTGVAGIAAAETIRHHDTVSPITLVGDEPHGYYSRPGLAYLLTGEILERQLFPVGKDHFQNLKLRLLHNRVAQIHPEPHRLEMKDGSTLAYDRLLIASGAGAVRANVPGSDLEGVIKLDSLDDVRHILKLVRRTRSAIVVGGGITSLELVEGLLKRGVKPHYFLRGNRYWENVLDETESRIIEHTLKEEGVELHFRTELAEILGKNGRVVGVRTVDGRVITCEMVAVAIGVRPRIELAKSAGLKTDRGIVVNEYMQTSHPHIYAAGDVAQVFDPSTGKALLNSLWGPARDMGRAAGFNLAGRPSAYLKNQPFNVTRLAGLTTTIIGPVGTGGADGDLVDITHGDSEAWSLMPGGELGSVIAAQAGFDINHLRLLVGQQSLVGAVLMGDQTLSQPLHHLIASNVDITPSREKLLQPATPLAPLIINCWDSWRKTHADSVAV
jgi:NAD(P)H-nitrite reductase large subunit